jgi:hypothetical protein
MLTNREAIQITLTMLDSPDSSERCFGAKTLGDIGRSKNGQVRQKVLLALMERIKKDTNTEVVRLAERSIKELNGDFDHTWEKYNPQEPVGSLRDQYYLKRG